MSVTPADIATELGRSAPAPDSLVYAQWDLWIQDVRGLIAARLGDLSLLDQDNLDYVVRKAVAAQVRNTREDGENTTSETVVVDDATVTKRWEDSEQADFDITDAWWELLSPGNGQGAFTIRPYDATRRCRVY